MQLRIGQGYDVHAIGAGLPMFLGGVQIDCPFGFIAHSDGDVAIHALCDALLGAAALGDIGLHFPDNSPEWKGADSRKLLERVVGMLSAEGWKVNNADITIALQAPKLRPYIDSMREVLAGILGIDAGAVSVKATTTERLGFVGRGEGCEVWAVATITKES